MDRILTKITSARWLIAIMVTIFFGYMIFTNKVDSNVFIPVFTMIIGYYFGKDRDSKTKE